MPIGYKNSTNGSATIAINAMQAAAKPHHFLGINREGHASIVSTTGNPYGHLVLRGASQGSNYHLEAVEEAAAELSKAALQDRREGNWATHEDDWPASIPCVFQDVWREVARNRRGEGMDTATGFLSRGYVFSDEVSNALASAAYAALVARGDA